MRGWDDDVPGGCRSQSDHRPASPYVLEFRKSACSLHVNHAFLTTHPVVPSNVVQSHCFLHELFNSLKSCVLVNCSKRLGELHMHRRGAERIKVHKTLMAFLMII